MNRRVFREIIEQTPSLRRFLERFTLLLFNEVARCLACRQVHAAEQQLARWLLMCHDRVNQDEFPFTQGFLSNRLCVRRATVTELATQLREAELLDYRRGRIRIINRIGLEEVACKCYRRVRREYDLSHLSFQYFVPTHFTDHDSNLPSFQTLAAFQRLIEMPTNPFVQILGFLRRQIVQEIQLRQLPQSS